MNEPQGPPVRGRRPPGGAPGFTLIELMIVIVVLAILVSIAYPTYQDQMNKARRSAAITALSEMANLQEQFYADNFRYTTTVALLPYSTTSEGGDYALSVSAVGTNPPSYTVRAMVVAGSAQDGDTDCWRLELDSNGTKRSYNQSGGETTANAGCWRR